MAAEEGGTVLLELALSLPHDARSVPVARHIVRAGMQSLDVDTDCIHDVELALSEACTNVLTHGDPAAEYEVRLQLADERCVLRVIEVGQGLEHRLWAVPEPSELPDADAEHGRGLWLMRALMDRVGFRLLPGSGAVVSLEKRLVFVGGAESGAGRQ